MNIQQPETDMTTEPKRRGRPPRQEVEQTRRKKRGGVIGQRLGVAMSQLDLNKYKYRWINDDPRRLFDKTKEDDWDIVHQSGGIVKDDADDMGSAVSVVVGVAPDGSALRAYLCRKPIDYYREDQRMKSEELDKQLADLKRGYGRGGAALGDYVPNEGISMRQEGVQIRRGN